LVSLTLWHEVRKQRKTQRKIKRGKGVNGDMTHENIMRYENIRIYRNILVHENILIHEKGFYTILASNQEGPELSIEAIIFAYTNENLL